MNTPDQTKPNSNQTVGTNRGTIFEEQAKILSHQALAEKQFILRLRAPRCAAHARPGSFIHLQCYAQRQSSTPPLNLLRRPLSIMRVDANAGWLDILYKVVGQGTQLLSEQKVGETLACLGPIGQGFSLHADKPKRLLIGGGVGIPPMIFLAETIKNETAENLPFVIMGSEIPFPFKTQPSNIIIPGIPNDVIACMTLLEDWQIASRLCSLNDYPGCYQGYVTELSRLWIESIDTKFHSQIEIFSCGPTPMLQAVAKLAVKYKIACQISLEEFMACAVGGCAGCVVKVKTEQGPAMKRVCVDGPVFDAYSVF